MQRDGVSAGARNKTHAGCWGNDESSNMGLVVLSKGRG